MRPRSPKPTVSQTRHEHTLTGSAGTGLARFGVFGTICGKRGLADIKEGRAGMSGGVLTTLAQFAGQTVAAAAITDWWESVRGRFALLLGRGDARKTHVAEGWLAQTHDHLAAAAPGMVEQVQRAAAERWAGRFADFLDEDPSVEAELRALAEEVAARLATSAVSAAGHSVAAGGDVTITALGGGTAAAVIHGNVAPGNPTVPGPSLP